MRAGRGRGGDAALPPLGPGPPGEPHRHHAVVTTLLAVPYLLILPAVTRLAGDAGDLAVAGATLAAAATFAPLRRRVQDLVDRRFNRARYDAARTVAVFATRLRQQVDLDALQGELLATVDEAVQLTRAWLWLHSPATPRLPLRRPPALPAPRERPST